mgnify:CR=1 FL=1
MLYDIVNMAATDRSVAAIKIFIVVFCEFLRLYKIWDRVCLTVSMQVQGFACAEATVILISPVSVLISHLPPIAVVGTSMLPV